MFLAFHSGAVWSNQELVSRITAENRIFIRDGGRHWVAAKKLLQQIEPFGVDYLKNHEPETRKRRMPKGSIIES
ncbi:hypothetical protein D3C84_1171550 [compost metagenome]